MAKTFRGVKEVKFSILVPVYNVEKYIEQCVDSLLSQTYTDEYEIILVDDGSTDASSTICDRYEEKYPQKIKVIHKNNQGLISARDVGIKTAKGDYCLFVDSDDFAEKTLLRIVNEEIEKNNNPDMVVYSFQYYDNDKITKRKVDIPDKAFSEKEKIYFYEQLICSPTFASLCVKAVKTEILKKDPTDYTQYYEKNMGEDWLRSIHIFTAANNIACKNVALYNYRTNQNSISKNFDSKVIENQNMIHVYEQFLKYFPEWNMNNEVYLNKLKNRWLNETIYTFSNFYENAKNNAERKAVVDFDWDSFLPNDFSVEELENGNSNSILLYKKIKDKDYAFLRLHFLKKAIYKKYKKLKARIKG